MADKSLVAEWLRYANMDLDTAKYLFENQHPAPLEIICYHSQQAAEKFLKSITVSLGMEVVKTHDLLKVLDQYVKQIEIPREIVVSAGTLTQYATKTRYPQQIELDKATTKTAITHAQEIKQWAESEIAKIEDAEKKAEKEKSSEEENSKK